MLDTIREHNRDIQSGVESFLNFGGRGPIGTGDVVGTAIDGARVVWDSGTTGDIPNFGESVDFPSVGIPHWDGIPDFGFGNLNPELDMNPVLDPVAGVGGDVAQGGGEAVKDGAEFIKHSYGDVKDAFRDAIPSLPDGPAGQQPQPQSGLLLPLVAGVGALVVGYLAFGGDV